LLDFQAFSAILTEAIVSPSHSLVEQHLPFSEYLLQLSTSEVSQPLPSTFAQLPLGLFSFSRQAFVIQLTEP